MLDEGINDFHAFWERLQVVGSIKVVAVFRGVPPHSQERPKRLQ